MEDKKLIINENKTPFSVFEKRIDYSLVKNHKKSNKLNLKKIWSKIAIGFCSLLLLIGGGIAIYENKINTQNECPFKEGTYYYVGHKGDLGNLNFNEESYIVLTFEGKTGEGAFSITNKKDTWIIYGKYYNCEFDSLEFTNFEYMDYVTVADKKIEVIYSDEKELLVINLYTQNVDAYIKFQLDTE